MSKYPRPKLSRVHWLGRSIYNKSSIVEIIQNYNSVQNIDILDKNLLLLCSV